MLNLGSQCDVAIPDAADPIWQLEAELLKMEQVAMPIDHHFCDGIYARTMHIPKGTILTGAVHRHECFFVVRQGAMMITTDAGPVQVSAGHMTVSAAGSKRAGYAIEDTVVTTYHANPTGETEPGALWDMYTIPVDGQLLTEGAAL